MQSTKKRYPLDKKFLETQGFRPEIQGLRALAVFLVVVYHIWFGRVSGGVDVFLFISAFLLSLSSIRKINDGKSLEPLKYWLHVFQRLLPAASVIIILTTIASYFVFAPSRMLGIIKDASATIFYYLNWHLAFGSVDYYAQNAGEKTPFQHFWSLSMQGQIFILWPLLFLLVAFLVRKLRINFLATALLIFGSVWVASLTFSILETYTSQGFAYFDTRTRLWEFASGTLLAILTVKWAPAQKLRLPMGWLGVIGLVTCGFLLPVQQAFPGYLALWPIVSGALVIIAGRTNSSFGADRILTAKPLLKLGECSYALYLVHWPLFILYVAMTEKGRVNFFEGTVLIIVSIILAYLLHRFVEEPLRNLEKKRYKPRRAIIQAGGNKLTYGQFIIPLATIITCLTLVVSPLGLLATQVSNREKQQNILAQYAGNSEYPGALSIGQPETTYQSEPIPSTDILAQFENLGSDCTKAYTPADNSLLKNCSYKITTNTANAPWTIIVGDSHAEQAIAMYRPIATAFEQNLASYLKGGCRFPDTTGDQECADFNRKALQEILAKKPQNVLLISTSANSTNNQEKLIPGIEDAVKTLTEAGINVIGVRDSPRYTSDMYECAQNNKDNLSACSTPVSEKLAAVNPAQDLAKKYPRFYSVDLTDAYCPNGMCQALIGNIYVYIDNNHISKAYESTTAKLAYEQLKAENFPGVQ